MPNFIQDLKNNYDVDYWSEPYFRNKSGSQSNQKTLTTITDDLSKKEDLDKAQAQLAEAAARYSAVKKLKGRK